MTRILKAGWLSLALPQSRRTPRNLSAGGGLRRRWHKRWVVRATHALLPWPPPLAGPHLACASAGAIGLDARLLPPATPAPAVSRHDIAGVWVALFQRVSAMIVLNRPLEDPIESSCPILDLSGAAVSLHSCTNRPFCLAITVRARCRPELPVPWLI